jgi:sporulation protein YlmC with PRC-barrel domain
MKGTTMANETNELQTYAIRRLNAWASPQELEQVAVRSKQVADDEFPTEVRWIRSHVIAEEDGTLGSVCIYQAVSPEAIRKHAQRVGMPADQIWKVADTVIIRPDPVKEAVA